LRARELRDRGRFLCTEPRIQRREYGTQFGEGDEEREDLECGVRPDDDAISVADPEVLSASCGHTIGVAFEFGVADSHVAHGRRRRTRHRLRRAT
jgi:hypothetical protein